MWIKFANMRRKIQTHAYVAMMSPMFLLSSAGGTSRFTSSDATAMSTDRRREAL